MRLQIALLLIGFIVFSKLKYAYTDDDDDDDQYQIGVGIADITGPAAEINMMGMAKIGQNTAGIHLRLFSRAVIIVDNSGNRVCYITADLQGIPQIVKLSVVNALATKYGNLYRHENLLISATHTHSGPGGYYQYFLYLITSLGFVRQSFDALVVGILKSIDRAHNSLKPGYIYWNEGELLNSSINRSPAAYLNNPQEERDLYEYDTDKTMSLMKFVDLDGNPLAMINWFAVHPVSMNNTNTLISSDNKGYASLLCEIDINTGQLPGKGPFIAIFSNSNEGDSSPNTLGPICIDTGEPCDFLTSTCNGNNQNCIAFGPGSDMFESTKIIAQNQYNKAMELLNSAQTRVTGGIQYIYQNIDMSNYTVLLPSNQTIQTCSPALGFSFAAGTTDGPGAPLFHQATTNGEVLSSVLNYVNYLTSIESTNTGAASFLSLVIGFLTGIIPTLEVILCQNPKAVLLPAGELYVPYEWVPDINPTQLIRIGDVVIAGVPAELTTMSGRRMRAAINNVFAGNGQNVTVVISGLANTYSNYVATYEEYQIQRYEGGSTMYGPHTLDAYIQQFTYLANNMVNNQSIAPGEQFPNLLSQEISLVLPVIYDAPPLLKSFGNVLQDVSATYNAGQEVEVTFVGANPRNNLQLEGTFLTVETLNSTSGWKVIATDANWETKFMWERTSVLLGTSQATVLWDIPINTPQGTYRIRYFGNQKNALQQITAFSGTSSQFKVIN